MTLRGAGTFFDCLPTPVEMLEEYISQSVFRLEYEDVCNRNETDVSGLLGSQKGGNTDDVSTSSNGHDDVLDKHRHCFSSELLLKKIFLDAHFTPLRTSGWEHVLLAYREGHFNVTENHEVAHEGQKRLKGDECCSSYVSAATLINRKNTSEKMQRDAFALSSRITKNSVVHCKTAENRKQVHETEAGEGHEAEVDSIYASFKGEVKKEAVSLILSLRFHDAACRIREEDIMGLDQVKKLVKEKIIYPIKRPELHYGLREAPKGVLLFGPPGTGKTMIAQWIATESAATFFVVRPSSLLSKYYGETETSIKALFLTAEYCAPSVIFIDEIDGLLGKRKEQDQDACIRMKNELLLGVDGLRASVRSRTSATVFDLDALRQLFEEVMVIGATNRPEALDPAAVRRLTRRILVPLPEVDVRIQHLRYLLKMQESSTPKKTQNVENSEHLTDFQLRSVATLLEGWSAADIKTLCMRAADFPYQEALTQYGSVDNIPNAQVFRSIGYQDLLQALEGVKPSSTKEEEQRMRAWEKDFGSL